ncbi:hypothetical protein BGW36DRAFT_364365 [Talaromyces proteolyticus]|uniref:Uncharacterized protein n=1 Tax=Talaromyces proteolyticus TaxID=1131652 RepID=A0AAD4PVX8_9EURO|nr:uncharacterized protein BGW36DRAFT_364365 [Talaromyces proteolyticus]KAH8690805.1 hypothetical protein BGW36DRAFT_364365 [Talaromyces proteolyticus]
MTAASAAAPPPVGENGVSGHTHGPTMAMPRFHPIAINPNVQTSAPPGPALYRPYATSIIDHGPPPPPPPHHAPPGPPLQQQTLVPHQQHPPLLPSQIDQIEARLRQIEHEESSRAAARAHTLNVRKREDEEFRMITERAEAEEDELRRRRKRLKRESMGLTFDGQTESPPPPTPRRLSETSAATTLAFFKQQSPPEPRPPASAEMRPPPPAIIQQPTPMVAPGPIVNMNMNMSMNGSGAGTGTFRKKQKYTIKNAEAWGERHGRPATYDPAGRALWKRPSDGQLVYLDCPAPDCGKSDFVTLHGFMCHLTKKHKDRSLGSQSRALDLCGTVYDPNAPRPQRPSLKRASTEGSRAGSMHTDPDEEYSSNGSDNEGSLPPISGTGQRLAPTPTPEGIKKEAISPPLATEHTNSNGSSIPPPPPPPPPPLLQPRDSPPQASTSSTSNKASIASMIDSNVRAEAWTSHSPRPSEPAAVAVKEESAAVQTPSNSEVQA